LLTIDALRADHLSTYGYERKTDPSIASVAEESVVFTRAFTTVPKTSPAYASMFTGLYPQRNGLRMLGQELAEENVTLAEILRDRGYATAGFVSSTVMIARLSGLDQGFDIWDDHMPDRELGRTNYERRAAATAARTTVWAADANPPFFLFVHLIDPHGPYHPPGVFRRRFVGGPEKLLADDEIPAFQRLPGARTLADYTNAYDGEIAYADAALGDIVAVLKKRGLYDRALIVITADHGESLGEDGYYFRHGKTLREVSTRIPLIVKPPGGRGAGVAKFWHDPVSLIDILPTVADYAAVSGRGRDRLDGESLRPVLEGKARIRDRVVFSQREGRGRLRRAAHGRYGSYLHAPCGPEDHCEPAFEPAGNTADRAVRTDRRARLAAALAEFDAASRDVKPGFRVRWRYRPGDETFIERFATTHNARWKMRRSDDVDALRSLGYID
jgi:arylsulfatase